VLYRRADGVGRQRWQQIVSGGYGLINKRISGPAAGVIYQSRVPAVEDFLLRSIDQLFGRTEGPLHSRFVLQPLVAALIGVHAGLRDARLNRPPYLWAVLKSSGERLAALQSGWKDIGKVFVMAFLLDAVYQIVALGHLYVRQALIIAVALAIVPYVMVRGPVARLAVRARAPSARP
jgi:hypothetical protein